ncbi:MAG: hypothetical protein KJ667_01710 [Alphaproteobacteria bacterium]|nr:hypothetical protein [Alphaproteobacteria bacterium]
MDGFSNTWLGGLVTLGAGLYGKKQDNETAAKLKLYETQIAEQRYREAREQRAASEAAAVATKNIMSSDMLNKVVVWTLTTIAGGLLVTGVLRMVGAKA